MFPCNTNGTGIPRKLFKGILPCEHPLSQCVSAFYGVPKLCVALWDFLGEVPKRYGLGFCPSNKYNLGKSGKWNNFCPVQFRLI